MAVLLRNPYGLQNGKLVNAADVERGLACNCVCPACGDRLQAQKGSVRQPHFSHRGGADCGAGYQTALHLMAKEILAEEKKVAVPPLTVRTCDSVMRKGVPKRFNEDVVQPRTQLTFENVELERSLGRIIPDVVLSALGRKLLVEIRVSHAVDETKTAKIKALNVSAIEFDFSTTCRSVTRIELHQLLTATYGSRAAWIHNSDQAAAQERVNQKYLGLFRSTYDDAPANWRLWPLPSKAPILTPPAPSKPRQLPLF